MKPKIRVKSSPEFIRPEKIVTKREKVARQKTSRVSLTTKRELKTEAETCVTKNFLIQCSGLGFNHVKLFGNGCSIRENLVYLVNRKFILNKPETDKSMIKTLPSSSKFYGHGYNLETSKSLLMTVRFPKEMIQLEKLNSNACR